MTLSEIKNAILSGEKVYWHNPAYEVIKDNKGQWMIKHIAGHCIGLTWADDITMNGNEEDFKLKLNQSL